MTLNCGDADSLIRAADKLRSVDDMKTDNS